MRGHHNQITSLILGNRDNALGRMLVLHMDDIARHSVRIRALNRAV
jgi:hypothetical protein